MDHNKLRLGLLLDSYEVPAWAFAALERVKKSCCAEITLIVLNDCDRVGKPGLGGLWHRRHHLVYELFNQIDERLDHREPKAFKIKNLHEILSDVPAIHVKPGQMGKADYFAQSDIAIIKEYGLDILIKMGFGPLQGEILSASKYGVWSYYHGDPRVIRGGPPGFWEVVKSWPETGCVLHTVGEDSGIGKILYASWSFTHPFSPARNRSYYFWSSASFLSRQIELLHRLGDEQFFQEIEKYNRAFNLYDHKYYEAPANLLALRLILKLAARIIYRIYQKAFLRDQWYLLVDQRKNSSLSFSDFKKIMPPKDRFWTDPHVIQGKDNYFIFIEEYPYRAKKGHLSVLEMDKEGNVKNPVQILKTNYHLSFPFVFEWQGRYYLVPESAENRTIDLYECIEFPYQWKYKMTLMENVTALDTILFRAHDQWWLFTGIAENEGSIPQVELFLFFSNELFTKNWNPHPMNPLVSDVKSARQAGGLIVKDGKLYRPSQDCSKMYGFGFDLNEILALSENDYLEKKVASVRPEWDRKVEATHTIVYQENLVVIDAFTRRGKFF